MDAGEKENAATMVSSSDGIASMKNSDVADGIIFTIYLIIYFRCFSYKIY